MANKRQVFFLHISILILIIIQSCNGYSWVKDSDDPIRPPKYHPLIDPGRYLDRTKQYQNTMEKLKFWRRSTDNSDEDIDASSEIFQKFQHPE